jgi:hypothetical protein
MANYVNYVELFRELILESKESYISLHHAFGESYDDEMTYKGYKRVNIKDIDWHIAKSKITNHSTFNFGRCAEDYIKRIKKDKPTKGTEVNYFGFGNGEEIIFNIRLDNIIAIIEGIIPEVKAGSIEIKNNI